jgi:secondary thiamine-phosphate synthase enzyme
MNNQPLPLVGRGLVGVRAPPARGNAAPTAARRRAPDLVGSRPDFRWRLVYGKLLADEGTDEAHASWSPHAHFNLRRGPIGDARPMRQATTILEFETRNQGLVEITREVKAWVAGAAMREALLTLFCRHTSASLLIQENAAPEVRSDLEAWFARIAPEDPALYDHDDEGPDDMPAHLRTALTQVQLSIPLIDGRLALGTWQGIYLFEHRRAPHRREVALHLIGE